MTTKPPEPTVTLPISQLVDLCLGRNYWTDRPIPEDVAELLLIKANHKPIEHGFWIQHTDEFGNKLHEPVLWYFRFWADVAERRARQQRRAEEERKARFVAEANVKLVAKYVTRELGIEGDGAIFGARRLLALKKMGPLFALGIEKLYTTIEEIP